MHAVVLNPGQYVRPSVCLRDRGRVIYRANLFDISSDLYKLSTKGIHPTLTGKLLSVFEYKVHNIHIKILHSIH
jgi:hypothetical protein